MQDGSQLGAARADDPLAEIPDGPAFTTRMLDRLLTDLHARCDDNLDVERYPEGRAALTPLLVQRSKVTFNLLVAEAARLRQAWALLEDAGSRALFLDLLAYRLAGPDHVRLPVDRVALWRARRLAEGAVLGPSALEVAGPIGRLRHCELPFLGRLLRLEAWPSSIACTFYQRQYFFERGPWRIAPEPGEVVVDGGACLGDTALAFAAAVGEQGEVHAFEPGAAHLAVARQNLAANAWARVTLHPCGLAERDNAAPPLPIASLAPWLRLEAAGGLPLPLCRLDTLLARGTLPRLDFVKMDIEGAELAALQGAEQALRRFRPKLAISLYHRPEDLFAIPLWLHGLGLGYRFFLDHYTLFDEETVLYAIARPDPAAALSPSG